MNAPIRKSLLAVLAHPEDESFLMGGTLAKYAAEDKEIALIYATLGELGIPDVDPSQAAIIREKELRMAAAVLGIHNIQFMRYRDGSLSDVDSGQVVSHLMNAMRRIHPLVVITFGPDGISGNSDHVAISRLVTTAFDRAHLRSFLPLSARLFYVVPSLEIAVGPVASVDITDYRLPKVRAMKCHTSQDPPFKGKPEVEMDNLARHEYFALAHPTTLGGEINDLFIY
jgi:LmbE family N-acetylglucosaminyl deacetylase